MTTTEEQQQSATNPPGGATEYQSMTETENAQGVGSGAEAEDLRRYQTMDLDLEAGYHDHKSR